MKATQQTYQTIRLTVANGTAANQTKENDGLRLKAAYNKITGISVVEVADGGISKNYQVGARDSRDVWQTPVNVQNLLAGPEVGPNQKYLDVNIPYSDGELFYATIINQALLTSDLTIDMTLRLEKDLTELNKQA